MADSRPLFIFVFSLQLTVNKYIISKFADDLIRTADLWCRKRPPYKLSHNHCPIHSILDGNDSAIHIPCIGQGGHRYVVVTLNFDLAILDFEWE